MIIVIKNKSTTGQTPEEIAFLKLESAVVLLRTRFLWVRSRMESIAIINITEAVVNPRNTEKDKAWAVTIKHKSANIFNPSNVANPNNPGTRYITEINTPITNKQIMYAINELNKELEIVLKNPPSKVEGKNHISFNVRDGSEVLLYCLNVWSTPP
jgi:hypothetical protein